MAEKKQTATYEGIMKSLREGQFSPIYILMGEESYFIDKITDYIAQHALREEERDFNQTVCFGIDVSAGQVADMARRFPMMAERQVVIVKEAQNIKNWDRLEQYFEKPQTSTVLVIAYKNGTIDGRKKILAKALAAGGVVFESKKKRDYELPAFIESYLKTKKEPAYLRARQGGAFAYRNRPPHHSRDCGRASGGEQGVQRLRDAKRHCKPRCDEGK